MFTDSHTPMDLMGNYLTAPVFLDMPIKKLIA
jgi:hypothetical protein